MRARLGWKTEIWVITGLWSPTVVGGLYYQDDDYLPSEIRTTVRPIIFTPRAGSQRAANEWKYLYQTGIPNLTADVPVMVYNNAGRLIDPHEPDLSEHLSRLRDALETDASILGVERHRLLVKPLSELLWTYMTAVAIH